MRSMENPFKFGTIVEMNFNRTNKWIMQRLASDQPLQSGHYPTSTVYSALKRLQKDGLGNGPFVASLALDYIGRVLG